MPSVIVNIDADGNVKVEAAGVSGSGCQLLTRALEAELGRTVGDVKKPEFFQQQSQPAPAQAGSAQKNK